MMTVDYPPEGWKIGDILVLPPNAYVYRSDWLAAFEKQFPDKAKRMHAYSNANRWSDYTHARNWAVVCIGWLNKQTEHDR